MHSLKTRTHAFVKKVPLSFNLFSVKSRLETVLTEFVDKRETFFDYKKKFSISQKWHFPEGVNSCFWSKHGIFFIIFSLKITLEVRVNNVLDRKRKLFGL